MNTPRILAALLVSTACASAMAQKSGSTTPAPDVVPIDQARATAGGITAGDAAGFPIHINQPGSYRLMSNLVVPAGVDGILVNASNVTIDLNGFSVTGPGSCSGSGASMSCSATTTRGISSAVSNIHRLGVRNGVIGGFGVCLEARLVARVSDVALHDCNWAMLAFDGSIVSQVSVHRAAEGGVVAQSAVDGLQLSVVRSGISTSGSSLRGVTMSNVYQAFTFQGGTNSALSQSVINATVLGNGVQSVGSNLCNGVAC